MITRQSFDQAFGDALKRFCAEVGADPVYYEEDGECVSITIRWQTPKGLAAKIGLSLEEEGISILSFLENQSVNIGRSRSWQSPSSKFLARLREMQRQLDAAYLPPLGRYRPDGTVIH